MSHTEGEKDPNKYFSTRLLYIEDSYIRDFEAKVVKAGPRFAVLDQTAFYPESGGQPSDGGVLTSETGEFKVKKVLMRGREVFHYLEEDIPVGSTIRGVIDWDLRYENMRRHSAEHLLTGLFEKEDAGPKVYSDLTRLEFKPSSLTEEAVLRVEAAFNEAVESDVPVRIYYVSRDDLDVEGDERKKGFLEKIPRNIRVIRTVEIGRHALTFCFGTHVRSTKELGPLSELALTSGKKGRKIVSFLLG